MFLKQVLKKDPRKAPANDLSRIAGIVSDRLNALLADDTVYFEEEQGRAPIPKKVWHYKSKRKKEAKRK